MKVRASRSAFTLLLMLWLPGCAQQVQAPHPPSDQTPELSGFKLTPVVENLEHPWAVTWLPEGDLLITERGGKLWRVRGKERRAVAGVPEVYAEGQGGLLDITLHPRFEQTRWVYLSFARGTSEANALAVARGRLEGDRLEATEIIFEVAQKKDSRQHFGSRFVWLPDGTLLVAVGDGGNPPTQYQGKLIREQAQNWQSHLGKVLAMSEDGKPIASTTDGRDPYVYSIGHRNIQGMVRDPLTGRVWATEHGSQGGDELNLIERGKNYGWPVVSYSNEYGGGPVAAATTRPDVEPPRAVWTPSVAPSGLAIYTGERFPEWKGNLFSGGLRGMEVRRIVLDASGRVVREERLRTARRIRDVRQGPDGFLYVLTDESDGALLRIEPQ
ncbi:MAG: PQQ-dependent sugar dehydrogenase [Casimicrobiaceae bacterium]|nr:PQQ-dependent sugar dehydrogenase [Casimicrobiaceae bacterium]MCX8098177.1 PQQ-dependent sugar dehydrogenase [Casimicrobiaceae bacterium]MDW8312775.1 PQQ-dependent sugar dehydrogenase [Burkholderiales bacterium]